MIAKPILLFNAFIVDGSSGNDRQYLWSEFILLRSLKHANIIRLIGVCSWRGMYNLYNYISYFLN